MTLTELQQESAERRLCSAVKNICNLDFSDVEIAEVAAFFASCNLKQIALSEMHRGPSLGVLNEAVEAFERHQEAEEAKRREAFASLRRLTKEERIAQRAKSWQRDLLRGGLDRLRAGKAPTKTQLPLVQRYLLADEAELEAALWTASNAKADADYKEWLYFNIVPMWNSVCQAIDGIGISYYHTSRNNSHGWRGEAHGITEERDGYATEAEALSAALVWRLERERR